ncbi:hypothetical protein HDR58_04185 [bacterium]|nr:hypothetical protein [bacterium]
MLMMTVCICAVATAGAVQTVHAASVSSVDAALLSGLVSSGDGITLYASYDSYYGSISSTYLEYMRGYLSKLPPDAHYVGARVGQYDYVFAYGADLVYDGSSFSGAVTVIRWNTYNNGTMYETYDPSFHLDPGSYLVYSDLSGRYPSLASSADVTLRQILILLTIFCLCLTVDHMYQVRKIRRLNRKENR